MYRHPVTLPLITDQIMTWTWQGCFTLSTMQSEKYFLPGCLCTNCDLFAKTSNMLSSLKQTWNKMEKPWSFELRVDFNSEQTFIRRKIHFNEFSFLVILCSFEMFCFHNSSYYYGLLSGSLGLEINFWKFAPSVVSDVGMSLDVISCVVANLFSRQTFKQRSDLGVNISFRPHLFFLSGINSCLNKMSSRFKY